MKKLILSILTIFVISSLALGQASQFAEYNNDRTRDPRMDQMNFVPNEVLVKFKDNITVNSGTQLKSAGISSIDQILKAKGVASLEKLFPRETKLKSAKVVKDPQGRPMVIPSLNNIYKIVLPELKSTGSAPTNIYQVIKELNSLPEVEYAEPNYIYSVDELKSIGTELTSDNLHNIESVMLKSSQTAVVPNGPLYIQQGYIAAVTADAVWEQTTGDTTQVIAILDTGVDWNHPDLKNKMWHNTGEIPGNGQDDDGNGLIDDYMGWDYINNDNNPLDDNSHGTHVAGIAAAETNNGIGIAGVNWNAKIMPIKVFQSSGLSDASTIAQGIIYASQKGATVINMSFGSYARSFALEDALINAYASAILVAAAGNDEFSIYDTSPTGNPLVFYPAGLSFVFGVQSDGGYSNFDPDGPVHSDYEGFNYELKAPGMILSTVPNGNYKVFQGTSMATPIISGSIALYQSLFPEKGIEELWSDFIHSSNGIIDLNSVFFNSNKLARLDLLEYELKDVNDGCDNDGHADANEIIDIIVNVRNTGSPAENVYVKIKQSDDGDPNDITILKDSIYLGSIGIFRSLTNALDAFKIKINSQCYNNRVVSLDVTMRNQSEDTLFIQKLKFKIYNGEELSGILLRDTTLTPDKNWVITNSLRIGTGVTVTILPGTNVEIIQGVDNRGQVVAIGLPDKRISMLGAIGGDATYKYVDLDLKGVGFTSTILENCTLKNLNSFSATKIAYSRIDEASFVQYAFQCDTIFRCSFNNIECESDQIRGNIIESVFDKFISRGDLYGNIKLSKFNIFNILINTYVYYYPTNPDVYLLYPTFLFNLGKNQTRIYKNSFINNELNTWFVSSSGLEDDISVEDQYWGTSDPNKIRSKYYDFMNNSGLPYLNFEPKLVTPSDSCQAHVWKILVNGKDAQDETIDPLGVGKHRFDVYFNRPMKKEVTPQVTYGGIYPYTSTSVNEDGEWSEDGKIYTVYKTIKLTNADGINRIRVAKAMQEADWGWEIPIEDQRFNFIIAAASSASLEFLATPGLGKVALEWNNNELEDGLGYNMYRMEQINDTVLTSPILINSTLITDTLYTDFSVTPNKKYYYYYKILRTNLAETDSSKVVSAIPFTASKGDANGDLSVNVLDITTIVAFLLNNNPQPFIFEAADVNSDEAINVLDIVGTVNLVLGGEKSAALSPNQSVNLYMQNDTLFADLPVAIGGIQFDFSGVSSIEEIVKLKALNGFESGYSLNGNTFRIIFYSLSGKTVPIGNHIPLLILNKGSGIIEMVFGDKNGSSVMVNFTKTGVWNLHSNLDDGVAELGQNYPNPFALQTTIPVFINEPVDEVWVRIINAMGQEIDILQLSEPLIGKNLLQWDQGKQKGLMAYILEIRRNGKQAVCGVKKMLVQ